MKKKLQTALGKFLQKTAESDLFSALQEMGYDHVFALKFQKKRFLKVVTVMVAGIMFSFFFAPWLFLIGIILGGIVWLNEYKRMKRIYNHFKFQKNLAFAKFMRMLIPYLLQTGATVYGAFNSMLTRIEDEHLINCLKRLLVDMNQNPNSDKPFRNFALDASGTDQAILFLTTLYDYQQSSADTSVIFELGQMANEQLFAGIKEIVAYKVRKFVMFPTKLVMVSFLIVLGYATAVITDVVTSIKL